MVERLEIFGKIRTLWAVVILNALFVESIKEMEYFTQFGYFPEGSENSILSVEARSRAIRTFQKINDLPVTGEMDEATERAMQVPRCGRPDNPYESRRRKRGIRDDKVQPWKGDTITFGVFRGSVKNSEGDTRAAMQKAAEVWMKHANIKLVESAQNPQINMSYQSGRHAGCNSPFSEMTLAHAFPPSLSEKDQLGGDIHFNEMFTFNMEEYTSARGTSLLSVMTHEMGHSLGLPHNLEDRDSIMFPSELARPAKVTQIDKYRLQMLYGSPKEKEEAKKKMEEEIEKKPTLKPDTCKSSVDAITMHDDKFYVFKDEWMWLISYDGNICDEPTLIEKTIDGVSGPIDAAVSIDDHTGKPPQLWLFKKNLVFVTDGSKLLHGPMTLRDFGLPERVTKIDLAYKWYYFDPPAVYIWSGSQYWKLDSSYHYRKIEPAYPRLIKRNWKDAPENADAAFSKESELHFVAGNRIYRMNSTIHTVPVASGYPMSIEAFWPFCRRNQESSLVPRAARQTLKFANSKNHLALSCIFILLTYFLF